MDGSKFKDRQAAHDWVIDNQLGRRNLNPQQASHLRGLQYRSQKKDAHSRPGNQSAKRGSQSDHRDSTSEELAKKHGVSPATIKRDAKFSEAVDEIAQNVGPDAKAEILAGKHKKSDVANLKGKSVNQSGHSVRTGGLLSSVG